MNLETSKMEAYATELAKTTECLVAASYLMGADGVDIVHNTDSGSAYQYTIRAIPWKNEPPASSGPIKHTARYDLTGVTDDEFWEALEHSSITEDDVRTHLQQR